MNARWPRAPHPGRVPGRTANLRYRVPALHSIGNPEDDPMSSRRRDPWARRLTLTLVLACGACAATPAPDPPAVQASLTLRAEPAFPCAPRVCQADPELRIPLQPSGRRCRPQD